MRSDDEEELEQSDEGEPDEQSNADGDGDDAKGSDITGSPLSSSAGGSSPVERFDAVGEGSEGGADDGDGVDPPEAAAPNLPKNPA